MAERIFKEPFQRGLPGTHDEAHPVRSLTRLYSQAGVVAARLRARAAAWAAASGSALHPRPDPSPFLRLPSSATLLTDEEGGGHSGAGLAEWIRTGLVKSPERAVEKALVCYEGDVSRVVDICRVRLEVDGPAQAAAAAAAVEADPAVRVVRVKNSMLLAHAAHDTAGFRVRRPGSFDRFGATSPHTSKPAPQSLDAACASNSARVAAGRRVDRGR
jgi:hypothetical protein